MFTQLPVPFSPTHLKRSSSRPYFWATGRTLSTRAQRFPFTGSSLEAGSWEHQKPWTSLHLEATEQLPQVQPQPDSSYITSKEAHTEGVMSPSSLIPASGSTWHCRFFLLKGHNPSPKDILVWGHFLKHCEVLGKGHLLLVQNKGQRQADTGS